MAALAPAQAAAAGKIALISMERLAYDYFDLAEEAISEGANILLFPEWGFVGAQTNLEEALLARWRAFAARNGVYIALDARYRGRNTLFVWAPTGEQRFAVRRDGNGSPVPTDPTLQEPLVLDTEWGRLGFLICDEARITRFLDEIQGYDIDALLVPNNTYTRTWEQSLQERTQSYGYRVDVYHADVLRSNGLFASAGKLNFLFDSQTQSIVYRPFGQPQDFNGWAEFPQTADGQRYVISYHVLDTVSARP